MATPEELEIFNNMLKGHVINDSLTIEETIAKEKKFISFLNAQIKLHTEFIKHLESTEGLTTMFHHAPFDPYTQERCENLMEDVEKQEKVKQKQVKKYLKNFFKENPNFREVPERKGCHALLIFDEDNLQNHHLFLNDDSNQDITEAIETDILKVVYLINTNPRDSKSSSYGYIKHAKPGRNFSK